MTIQRLVKISGECPVLSWPVKRLCELDETTQLHAISAHYVYGFGKWKNDMKCNFIHELGVAKSLEVDESKSCNWC